MTRLFDDARSASCGKAGKLCIGRFAIQIFLSISTGKNEWKDSWGFPETIAAYFNRKLRSSEFPFAPNWNSSLRRNSKKNKINQCFTHSRNYLIANEIQKKFDLYYFRIFIAIWKPNLNSKEEKVNSNCTAFSNLTKIRRISQNDNALSTQSIFIQCCMIEGSSYFPSYYVTKGKSFPP